MMQTSLPALRTIVGTIIIFLTLLAGGKELPAAGTSSLRTNAWQPIDCATFQLKTEVHPVECGYVTVPRRHADPSGPAIRLATVIIKSEAADPQPDPLFIAQGGPGGSSIDSFAQILISSPDFRPVTNRDLVVWDQRGTFYSQPALLCSEVSKATLEAAQQDKPESAEGVDAKELESYRVCGARLTREAGDLSAFNSVENANDIETLRVALGYDTINFYGVSYGTELGQYLMRQHPAHLRSVVLDAVVPMQFNLVTDVALVKQRIAEKYFQGCTKDARCNDAFPELAKRFLALLDRLDKAPVTLSVTNPKKPSEQLAFKLSGEDLADALYQALYIRQAAPLIPYIVDRADKGDFSFISGFLLPLQLFEGKSADGMYMSVLCAERGDSDPGTVVGSGLNSRLVKSEQQGARTIVEICRNWKIALLPRDVLQPVKSEVPTLLLSGEFDPITPPAFATQVAGGLSRSQAVAFPSGTHGQAFEGACANRVIQQFVDNPGAPLEASCAAAPASHFMTPGDLIVIPPLREAAAMGTEAGLITYASRFALIALGIAVLMTAIPVYAIGEVSAILRGRRDPTGLSHWKTRFSAAAPWLPLLALVLFVGALVVVVWMLGATFTNNMLLTFLGAVPSSMRWVFALPLVGTVAVLLMGVATAVMWEGRRRTVLGRLYYLLLLMAAFAVVVGFWRLGFVTALFG